MFSTYEELKAAVEERRRDTLTLQVDLGTGVYSQEYEDAKKELEKAKAVRMLAGGQGFLSDSVDSLEAKVKELEPEVAYVWVRFKPVPLLLWASLAKQQGVQPIDQYEKVLPDTFVGIYGSEECTEPLSTDYKLVSSKSDLCVLSGATLLAVIGAFMDWQNAGGKVTIRPTKSAQD